MAQFLTLWEQLQILKIHDLDRESKKVQLEIEEVSDRHDGENQAVRFILNEDHKDDAPQESTDYFCDRK